MLKFDREEVFLLAADEAGRRKMRARIEEKHGGVNAFVIAKSILGREIEAYRVGEGKRLVAVFGAHHALESITANLAFLLINMLLGNSTQGSVNGVYCQVLLSKYSFIIVPCVNPDGIEMRYHGVLNSVLAERQMRMSDGDFSNWQANARGVDLNHNYNYRFSEYKRVEAMLGICAGATLYSGEHAESEPESHAVANLVRTVAPIAVVSLHSQGEEIFAYPKNPAVRRVAERLCSMSGYTFGEADGTAAYGGLCDYTGSLGIPSFTYELGRGKNPLHESDVYPIFERIAGSIILLPTLL